MTSKLQKSYIADWLKDDQSEGVQSSTSRNALKRYDERGVDGTITSAIGAGQTTTLPFKIYLLNSNMLKSSSSLQEANELTLLVNPTDINYGSTQLLATQYSRDGYVNSLWGPAQTTLTGNGSSAAFITTRGLTGAEFAGVGVSRRDSLAYANLMSFISVVKNNGYRFLGRGDSRIQQVPSQIQQAAIDEGSIAEANPNSVDQKNSNSSDTVYLNIPSIPFNLTGQKKNRVIHVLDTIAISYGGTVYLGSFNTFSLEASEESPFRFSYSFDFVCSGVLGDKVEGHLNDGENDKTGITLFQQGVNFDPNANLGMNTDKLQFVYDKLKVSDAEIALAGLGIPLSAEASSLLSDEDKTLLRTDKAAFITKYANVKDGVDFRDISDSILAILPTVYRVWAENGSGKPLITSANDSLKHGANSYHYVGEALDFRTNDLEPPSVLPISTQEYRAMLVAKVKAEIPSSAYNRLYESVGTDNEHLHISHTKGKSSQGSKILRFGFGS